MQTFVSKTASSIGVILLVFGATAFAGKHNEQVTINNTNSNPVPVNVQNTVRSKASDNPAFQPYQAEETVGTLSANGYFKTASFDVPAGKRLVIELVTVAATVDVGDRIVSTELEVTRPSANPARHELTATAQGEGAGGGTTFSVTQPLRAYSEAGTGSVRVTVERTKQTGDYNTHFSISGYLVDL